MKVLIVGTDLKRHNDLRTQGQFLRDILLHNRIDVAITSSYRNSILRIFDTVFQILRLHKNDIVIVQVYSTKGIYLEVLSGWLAMLKKCYVINTLHGGNIPFVYRSNIVKRKLLNIIFTHSDVITVPSKYIPSHIEVLQNNYELIRNHIDLKQYKNLPKPKDCIRIFWMRSYHPTYDPLKAIHILEYIRNLNMDAKLVMAGKDFGHQYETIAYAQSSKYAKDISITDVISTDKKNKIASESNVYICTNTIDNAPVSFLEMMAMGLPIVTTNVGGIPHYVENNQTALISTDNSVENMAKLIISLHQQEELQQKLITNGLSFIEEFSTETVLQKWLTLFQQLQYKQPN
ncbi:MAG: glycosyltransferase family 4 protein [Bacteroidota bacterium]